MVLPANTFSSEFFYINYSTFVVFQAGYFFLGILSHNCAKFMLSFFLNGMYTWQQTQDVCITFVQRRPNVFVGPTLY